MSLVECHENHSADLVGSVTDAAKEEAAFIEEELIASNGDMTSGVSPVFRSEHHQSYVRGCILACL